MKNEEQKNEIVLKNPEELTWDEFLDMLEIAMKEDNAIAREGMKKIIAHLREDDGYYWEEISDINALKLFEYAGYTKDEDIIKAYENIRSEERYQAYVKRQKAIRKANMANSPLGRLKARVGKFLT